MRRRIPYEPPRVPHISPETARSAQEHFQPYYDHPLTEEDGREIAANLVGFFEILAEWKRRDDERKAAEAPADHPDVAGEDPPVGSVDTPTHNARPSKKRRAAGSPDLPSKQRRGT